MTAFDADVADATVAVVLCESAGSTGVTPAGASVPLDLADDGPPTDNVLEALLDAAVELSAPVDLDAAVIRAITTMPVPPLFRSSPWLHQHRALVFTEGRCRVGGYTLRYHPQLGVHVEEPAAVVVAQRTPDDAYTATHSQTPSVGGDTFDLVTQPWVPAVGLDGAACVVGLRELLTRAHLLRRIAAEAPTMTAALYRVVLALFHRVYGPQDVAAWTALWATGALPTAPLDAYLARHADKFDLFHPQRPFLQCPQLRTVEPGTPGKLVPYRAVGNNVTLFDHTTAGDQVTLTPAEAARWLVTAHAFDPGGMKTPYLKDKSSEKAPCNTFGVVLVEGSDLKQTLLLNAGPYRPEHEKPRMTTRDDAPAWERESPTPHPERRPARGWTDMLTWPSRRILLTREMTDGGPMVTGVVMAPGTRLVADLPDEELMAAFRRPVDGKGRPKKDAPILPVRLQPVRGVWRHSVELLITDTWAEDRHRRRPRALDHIADLAEAGTLPLDTVYTLRVFGQKLDSKASVVEAWLEDEVPAPVALVRAQDEALGALIGAAIEYADRAGSILRALETDFRGRGQVGIRSMIDTPYWPRLSRPFGRFLKGLQSARLTGQAEAPEAEQWGKQVGHTARAVADRWVTAAAADAGHLRIIGKHHATFLQHLAIAYNTFRAAVDIYAREDRTPHD